MTVTRVEGTERDLEVRGVRTPDRAALDPRPLAALGLSVLWPGLGHAFLGRTALAAAFVTAQVVIVVLSVLPDFWRVTIPVWGVLVVVSAGSAWRAARTDRADQSGRSSSR